MFLVLLPPSQNRARAPEFVASHKAWIQRGLDDGVFLLIGGLKQGGGLVLAQGLTREALEARLKEDPFVAEDVVTVEIMEFDPTFAAKPLGFLLG